MIQFVKENATCAVLVSGRGNNFLYVHKDADWEMAKKVIVNAKISKISACNALDKVLVDASISDSTEKVKELQKLLLKNDVEVILAANASNLISNTTSHANDLWEEEFLAMRIMIEVVNDMDVAIEIINKYSGGHSAVIMTTSIEVAVEFMDGVDCAAVYHNASTRFTDGGQLGEGAELAISTDKLHHRGPLGLQQLVTNKYYIFGEGQVR